MKTRGPLLGARPTPTARVEVTHLVKCEQHRKRKRISLTAAGGSAWRQRTHQRANYAANAAPGNADGRAVAQGNHHARMR